MCFIMLVYTSSPTCGLKGPSVRHCYISTYDFNLVIATYNYSKDISSGSIIFIFSN